MVDRQGCLAMDFVNRQSRVLERPAEIMLFLFANLLITLINSSEKSNHILLPCH